MYAYHVNVAVLIINILNLKIIIVLDPTNEIERLSRATSLIGT